MSSGHLETEQGLAALPDSELVLKVGSATLWQNFKFKILSHKQLYLVYIFNFFLISITCSGLLDLDSGEIEVGIIAY